MIAKRKERGKLLLLFLLPLFHHLGNVFWHGCLAHMQEQEAMEGKSINYLQLSSSTCSSHDSSECNDAHSSLYYQIGNKNVRPITCQAKECYNRQNGHDKANLDSRVEKNNCVSDSSSLFTIVAGPAYRFDQQSILLNADVGLYSFYFGGGNGGTYAYQNFFWNEAFSVKVTVTDCYCGGDRFLVVLDDGINPSIIQAAASCNAYIPGCTVFSNDPVTCLANPTLWCQTSFVLDPGFYNLTIIIMASPFQAGTGFVKLEQYCNVAPCCQATASCNNEIFM